MSEEINEEKVTHKFGWKGFIVYFILLIIGVIALYPELYPVSQTVLNEIEADMSTEMFTWLSMIQPFLIAVGALLLGHFFAPKVRLRSLIYEKFDTNNKVTSDLKDSLLFAVIGGAIIGIVIIGFDIVFRPYLPELLQLPVGQPTIGSFISRLLYGGIVEEVMIRFGFMTVAIYIISMKGEFLKEWTYLAGIFLSAIVFALSHYGSTATYFDMTALIWIRMLVLNGIGGLFYGWMYWKYHLEGAILAHMFTHVTMTVLAIILAAMGI